MADEWQERIMERVRETYSPAPQIRPGRRPNRKAAKYASEFDEALTQLPFRVGRDFIGLMDRAAQVRDANRTTYVRRAVAVMVAHDLRMDIADVLYHLPMPGRYGRHQNIKGRRDDAVGIQTWCPHPGCDGSHLSQP